MVVPSWSQLAWTPGQPVRRDGSRGGVRPVVVGIERGANGPHGVGDGGGSEVLVARTDLAASTGCRRGPVLTSWPHGRDEALGRARRGGRWHPRRSLGCTGESGLRLALTGRSHRRLRSIPSPAWVWVGLRGAWGPGVPDPLLRPGTTAGVAVACSVWRRVKTGLVPVLHGCIVVVGRMESPGWAGHQLSGSMDPGSV